MSFKIMSFQNFRILPLLIVVAILAFSVRLVEVVVGVSTLAGEAFAEGGSKSVESPEQAEAAKNAKSDKDKKEGKEGAADQPIPLPNPNALVGSMDADKSGALQFPDANAAAKTADGTTPAPAAGATQPATDASKDTSAAAPASKDSKIGWQSPTDMDVDFSKSQKDLGDDLSKRRADLDRREKELQTKEALLKAGSQELDRKFQELTQLRGEIEKLLKQQSAEEDARVASLVKIYEGMKPADAARIFDTLDMDVLTSVMTKMSERKLSPIMAAMSPDRAKNITTLMAQQKQLPSLPPSQ